MCKMIINYGQAELIQEMKGWFNIRTIKVIKQINKLKKQKHVNKYRNNS